MERCTSVPILALNDHLSIPQALIDVFGIPNPSKSAIAKRKLQELENLCLRFCLNVGVSGKRGGRVKTDYVGAIVERLRCAMAPALVRFTSIAMLPYTQLYRNLSQ